MDKYNYEFANLNNCPDLIEEIKKLEYKLNNELSNDITLIAYTHSKPDVDHKTDL